LQRNAAVRRGLRDAVCVRIFGSSAAGTGPDGEKVWHCAGSAMRIRNGSGGPAMGKRFWDMCLSEKQADTARSVHAVIDNNSDSND
jgi:hypothetical protein